MQLSRHFYGIGGLAVILTALSMGSGQPQQQRGSATSVLVTNSTVPVTVSGSPSVKVQNSASNPMLVRDVDVASRIHVEGSENASITEDHTTGSAVMYQVPVGKRLIVEGIGARVFLEAGQYLSGAGLNTGTLFFPMGSQPMGTNDIGKQMFYSFIDVPFQVSGGNSLEVFLNRNGTTGTGFANISFTGYLVNEPVPAP